MYSKIFSTYLFEKGETTYKLNILLWLKSNIDKLININTHNICKPFEIKFSKENMLCLKQITGLYLAFKPGYLFIAFS